MQAATTKTSIGGEFGGLTNWSSVRGSWIISNDIVTGTSSVDNWALIHGGSTTWTNYQVTVNMSIQNPGGEAGLIVRYRGAVNFYWVSLGAWNHKYSIGRVVNDVYTELASSGLNSELQAGKSYAVTVLAVSSSIKMYVDGSMVLEISDNALPSGGVGFRTYGGTMNAQQMIVKSKEFNIKIQTNDGGYALAGYTNSYGAGNKDFWIVKIDSLGNQLWNKTYGAQAMKLPIR